MAEEEAIKTDNDSWRFEGETTIGLQPARAVSATRPAACRKSFFRKRSSRQSSQKFKESLIRKSTIPYQCIVGLVFALTAYSRLAGTSVVAPDLIAAFAGPRVRSKTCPPADIQKAIQHCGASLEDARK
jgi:hypothetical protein